MMRMFSYLIKLHPLLILLLSIFLLLHAILFKFRQTFKFSGSGPPTYPIVGCLVSFYKNRYRLLDWYTDLLTMSKTMTIVVHRFGATRTVVTANPENVEYILKKNFNNFPKGKPFTEILGDFLGRGIFNVDGELWHMQRKLASHEFSERSLKEYIVCTLEEEVESRLLPVLESFADNGSVVDMQELLRRLAFDLICKVILGIDPCCLDPSLPVSPLERAFGVASEICARRGAAPVYAIWKVKRALGIGSEKRLKEAVEEVRVAIEEIIQDKKKEIDKNGSKRNDLLSKLIVAGHDDQVIRDMVISLIMAGRDTTSAGMTWLLWLLSGHPNVEEEVLDEIEFLNKGGRLSLNYKSLKEMKLLKACLCESMRLYPPVSWDSKHAEVDDVLPDGIPVRRGDRVTYFPYGMGRMEALWGKDRFEFKPDRWFLEPGNERSALKKICPYKFPIFQAGPRVCLGKEMAFIQMKYVVASILRRFEIRPVGSQQPVFVPLMTAHMAGGLKVLVQSREVKRKNR